MHLHPSDVKVKIIRLEKVQAASVVASGRQLCPTNNKDTARWTVTVRWAPNDPKILQRALI
jgi:hypothetical protein